MTSLYLAYFCSEDMLKGWAEDKTNDKTADEMFDAYMKFYTACFERPADLHLGIHLCRGKVELMHQVSSLISTACRQLRRISPFQRGSIRQDRSKDVQRPLTRHHVLP